MHLPQRQSHLLLKLINYKHTWGKTSTAIAVWVQHLFFLLVRDLVILGNKSFLGEKAVSEAEWSI